MWTIEACTNSRVNIQNKWLSSLPTKISCDVTFKYNKPVVKGSFKLHCSQNEMTVVVETFPETMVVRFHVLT